MQILSGKKIGSPIFQYFQMNIGRIARTKDSFWTKLQNGSMLRLSLIGEKLQLNKYAKMEEGVFFRILIIRFSKCFKQFIQVMSFSFILILLQIFNGIKNGLAMQILTPVDF